VAIFLAAVVLMQFLVRARSTITLNIGTDMTTAIDGNAASIPAVSMSYDNT
jgi:hypothetical protein